MDLTKNKTFRDRSWLDELRDHPCLITQHYGTESDAVDPCHQGTAGKGIKSPDNEALPLKHSLHQESHNMGETSFWLRELTERPGLLKVVMKLAAVGYWYEHKGKDDA